MQTNVCSDIGWFTDDVPVASRDRNTAQPFAQDNSFWQVKLARTCAAAAGKLSFSYMVSVALLSTSTFPGWQVIFRWDLSAYQVSTKKVFRSPLRVYPYLDKCLTRQDISVCSLSLAWICNSWEVWDMVIWSCECWDMVMWSSGWALEHALATTYASEHAYYNHAIKSEQRAWKKGQVCRQIHSLFDSSDHDLVSHHLIGWDASYHISEC